jgi:hypothetical protein
MYGLLTAAAGFVAGINESERYGLFAPFIKSILASLSHSWKPCSAPPDVI